MDKIDLIDQYIKQCDEVKDNNIALRVVDDIISVFHDEIPRIDLYIDQGTITSENRHHQDKMNLYDLQRLKKKLENYKANIVLEEKKEVRKLKELEIQKSILKIENNNSNTNSNTVNLNLSFEDARKNIEDMSFLDDDEINEIIKKIDELEKIIKSNDRKPKKWDSAKDRIKFIADKGVDVGISLLPLFLQIK